MKIVKTISEIRDIVKEWKKSGYSIGLVPTMGYLHAGHGSLIEQSVKNNDKTVVSVFVNPTQFGPNEDLEKYPRDIKRDSELVSSLGGDIIFNPEPEEMYRKYNSTTVKVETAMPVNTKDTPEWDNNVNPRYFVTEASAFVIFPPKYAPPIFPMALEKI